jgi:aldose 1-epimerase
MKISVTDFGVLPGGEKAQLYTLENNNGMRVDITNYGGTVISLLVPDRQGKLDDVVLGHKDFEALIANRGYFGALVGRNANRIGGARFTLGDSAYELEKNNGENNLHGGSKGLSFRLFSGEVRTVSGLPALLLSCTVPDMEDGFPGTLNINVAYALTDENALMIDYRAVSDRDTVINLTNHAYFNLAGHASGNIYDHVLQLTADYYMPGLGSLLPSGEILSVEGTPFDFRNPRRIGEVIGSDHPQVKGIGGFDHNFVLSGGYDYRRIATVTEPVSGRAMSVFTDLPGVQLYTSNSLNEGLTYKDGASYKRHQAFCLETQLFPNAVNMPWLASPIYRAGEEYVTTTTYQFN